MRTSDMKFIEDARKLDRLGRRPHGLPTRFAIEAIGESNPSHTYAAARARSRAYCEARMAALADVRRAAAR